MTPDIIALSAETAATTGSTFLLGFSPADAGVFGTMIGGIIMAILGARKGEESRKIAPPETPYASIGAALIDRGPLQELTMQVKDAISASREQTDAIRAVAEAISKFAEASEERARTATKDAIEELGDKVDRLIEKEHKPPGRAR